MKPNRKSNIELLRILSIILIVLAHSVYYGCQFVEKTTFNVMILSIIRSVAKIGVNCFIIITGYFMINNSLKLSKILKVAMTVVMYSIFCLLVALIFNKVHIDKKFIVSIFPITFNHYWFATSYVLLCILSPYINKLLNLLSTDEFKKMLIVFFMVWVVVPTLTTQELGLNSLLWFCYLYSIGAYFRKISTDKELYLNFRKKLYIASIIAFTFLIFSVIIITAFSTRYAFLADHINYFSGMNKIPIIIISSSLFCFFESRELKYSKLINSVAGTMFGIYLIHENIYLRDIIWKLESDIIGNSKLYILIVMLFCMLLVIVLSFVSMIINAFIDLIYEALIEKSTLRERS